jgi:hypothetical protein
MAIIDKPCQGCPANALTDSSATPPPLASSAHGRKICYATNESKESQEYKEHGSSLKGKMF